MHLPQSGLCHNIFLKSISAFFSFLCLHYSNAVSYLSSSLTNFLSPACQYNKTCIITNTDTRDISRQVVGSMNDSLSSNLSCANPPTITNSLLRSEPIEIKVLYCNARSLIPKSDVLLNYVSLYEPFVVAVTETWLNSHIPSSLFCPPGYTVYRRDRVTGRGGGSLILVRDTVDSIQLDITSPSAPSDALVDAVACQLSFGSTNNVGILCIYRPPNSLPEDNSTMLTLITNFLNLNLPINIIVGDFNFPEIDWLNSCTSTAQSKLFFTFCQENFLTQHVELATRLTSNSLLDLVLSTYGTQVSDTVVSEEFGSSDHSVIQFSVKVKASIPKKFKYMRKLFKVDWNHFQHLLSSSSHEWEATLSTNDLDLVWDRFVNSVISALDIVAPHKAVTLRSLRSSSRVRTALRHKRRSYREYLQTPSTNKWIEYERARLIAENVLDVDTRSREYHVARSSDPRVFWSFVNRRMSVKPSIKSIELNGERVRDPGKIVKVFNEYFASIYNSSPSQSANNHLHGSPGENQSQSEPDINLQLGDIIDVLKQLPSKSSVDADNLSYKILKNGGMILAQRLLQLFSLSLELSRVPIAWKVAVVTPIHKKGPKLSISNYRPISVTSCCGRVLERIINAKLTHFLRSNNKLLDTQHGFLSRRSTDTIMLKFYDYVTDNLDNNLLTDCIFFDFKKAFDTVPHHLLISRLKATGIQVSVIRWISDFLSNRSQRVRVDQVTSGPLPVASGVIQGSVLGPTLFNIFINDIDNVLNSCSILKYADDTRIFLSSIKTTSDACQMQLKIQQDINNFAAWSKMSGMSLNVEKCFAVSFGQSFSTRNYNINGQPIPSKSIFCDLGMTVQSPIGFKPHVSNIVSQSFRKLAIINKVFKSKNQFTLIKLYKSFVRPCLEYASVIWSPYTQYLVDDIERVQRRFCRMLPSLRGLSYQVQLKSLRLLSLKGRRIRFQLITIYKMYNGISGLNFNDFFELLNESKTRGHTARIRAKSSCHNYRLYFFTVSSVGLWNQLSQETVDSPSISSFKSRIKAFFNTVDIW